MVQLSVYHLITQYNCQFTIWSHSTIVSLQSDHTVQLSVYHLITWYKIMMDSAFPIKKHNHHHLGLWLTYLFFFWSKSPFHTDLPYLWLSNWNVCKIFTKFAAKLRTRTCVHTHIHTYTHTFFKLSHCHIRWTACARAQFSGCSSTTNAHSEMEQMAVCCQNLTLVALSSCSTLSVLVGTLFKKFVLFLNKPHI
jgi:hypothetical protein